MWWALLYVLVAVSMVLYRKNRIPFGIEKKDWLRMAGIFGASVTLGFLLQMTAGEKERIEELLTRNGYGEGSHSEELNVSVEGVLEEEAITVVVTEQTYTEEELKEVFERCVEKLDETILGENKSLDYVDHDLALVSQVEGEAVKVSWTVSDYEVLDGNGQIAEAYDNEEGSLVELTGILSYGQEQAFYQRTAMVFPRVLSEKESFLKKIQSLVATVDEATASAKTLTLPDEVEGRKIYWTREGEGGKGVIVVLLGAVAAGVSLFFRKQKEKEEAEKRDKQLALDYPDIVSEMAMLLRAGMTVRAIWFQMAEAYERGGAQTGKRPAYEEMRYACRQMKGGVSEGLAYEEFGLRCKTQAYRKFATLLMQNQKRGTRGLADQLALESTQAFQERKANARKLGEEAGTKLLLPMFLMLLIVLLVIIVPAFLSVQL